VRGEVGVAENVREGRGEGLRHSRSHHQEHRRPNVSTEEGEKEGVRPPTPHPHPHPPPPTLDSRTAISFWKEARHRERYEAPSRAEDAGSVKMRMHVTMCSKESWSILLVRVGEVVCPSSMMPHMTKRQPMFTALVSLASSPARAQQPCAHEEDEGTEGVRSRLRGPRNGSARVRARCSPQH
jgi:hypothetical protein